MIRNEGDVRKLVKASFKTVWWIENKHGGTLGFPDAIVAEPGGRATFLELKVMEEASEGAFRLEATPAQLNVLKDMLDLEFNAALLVGWKGTRNVGLVDPRAVKRVSESAALGGRKVYEVRASDVDWLRF